MKTKNHKREVLLAKIAELWVIVHRERAEHKKYHIRHDSRETYNCLITMERIERELDDLDER